MLYIFQCFFFFSILCNFYATIHNYAISKHFQSCIQKLAKKPTHYEMLIFQIRIIVNQLFKNM